MRRSFYGKDICQRCAQAETEAKNERQRLVNLLGGGRAVDQFVFEKFKEGTDNKAAFDACKAFDPKNDNLYLFGGVGVGKSHLAISAIRQCCEGRARIKVIKPSQLLRQVRGKSGEDEQKLIDDFARYDCLLIDDIGVEKGTEFSTQIFYEIIDRRYMAYRNGLILTSNLSLDELAEKIGDDRMTSRIAGMCRVLKLAGDDRRMEKESRWQPESQASDISRPMVI